jgi:hypothetical protein
MSEGGLRYANPEELARARSNQGTSTEQSAAPSPEFPKLRPEAFYGPIGDIVRTIEPHTESDPALLLISNHVYFGNAIGRGPHFRIEGSTHYTVLDALFVGDTAKGRKGTGDDRVREVFRLADPVWCLNRVKDGMLSSGEGLIEEVRDARIKITKGEEVVVDEGEPDKRVLFIQSEFGGVLHAVRRDGSTLGPIIKNSWDGRDPLGTVTKHTKSRATGAHVSIIGHITSPELRKLLDQISIAGGLGNRFLFACVRRTRQLPFGGNLSDEDVAKLAALIQDRLIVARGIGEVGWNNEGADAWADIYSDLSEGKPGLVGALIARAEAQVRRLAMSYALWDGAARVNLDHLLAALALWEFCDASVRYIFGDSLGDPVSDALLSALKNAFPDALSRTELYQLFSRNESSGRIAQSLMELARLGLATMHRIVANGVGRPAEMWRYCPAAE